MGKRTPFYECHQQANAKIVDFAGWDMPLHYGSQLDEHQQVRQQAGMFDVSHMGVVDVQGPEVIPYLRYLLANNVDRLTPGKALYSCLLNQQGGVLDDLIVYQLSADFFRLVINAGTRAKDLAWLQQQQAGYAVTITECHDLAMLAVQGPAAQNTLSQWLPPTAEAAVSQLKPFTFVINDHWFIARTGYTGEDGFEIILPATDAPTLWKTLLKAGVKPCGLGARDTLRLEAGLNLYGLDMDETVTPLESNLGWTVALEPKERRFIGREAIEQQKITGPTQRLVGLVLQGPGIMRHQQKVLHNGYQGEITSGGYSPTLQMSIALARVPNAIKAQCEVDIRHKRILATVVKPPFVRNGKKMF